MLQRKNNIAKLKSKIFDVLIIGGGINGNVSASSLSSRGVYTALIDKGDFASYTSQESSNLIWGGIKYLETYEFSLVFKLCRSRNHLVKSFPSMIKEIRFLTSITKNFRKNRWLIYLGTLLYWFMGRCFTKHPIPLSIKKIKKLEKIINCKDIAGGFEYSDAFIRDNDARFSFSFIRRALNHGCIAANYLESQTASRDSNGVWCTKVRDNISGEIFNVRSKILINATGPFATKFGEKLNIISNYKILYSKGVHLVVRKLTDSEKILTFFADDGRLFFAIPLGPKTCIGTTDTRITNLPPQVTDHDRDFILDNINKRLDLSPPLTKNDILAERCGVRPLVVDPNTKTKGDADDWTSLSRHHKIELNTDRKYLAIFGGKLTDCLNIGEEVCQNIQKLGISIPFPKADWYGEPHPIIRDKFFHQSTLMSLDEMTSPSSSEPLSQRLWRRYGTNAFWLLEEIREEPSMADLLVEGTEYIKCELFYAARREMVVKLEDFLRRRSKIAMIAKKSDLREAKGLMEACKILFGDDAKAKWEEYFFEPESTFNTDPESKKNL